ncbi:hypothetical protein IQ64_35290 [Streptomyces stelliscabiei]|nr:hypothetical protein IQ64_35290 [Streptomyces stelliscabiei]
MGRKGHRVGTLVTLVAVHPDTATDRSAMATVGPSGQDRLPRPGPLTGGPLSSSPQALCGERQLGGDMLLMA